MEVHFYLKRSINLFQVCEFGGDDCVKTPSFIDRTALKYKEVLSERVERRYSELKEVCSLPDLPTPPSLPSAPPPLPLSPPVWTPSYFRIGENVNFFWNHFLTPISTVTRPPPLLTVLRCVDTSTFWTHVILVHWSAWVWTSELNI